MGLSLFAFLLGILAAPYPHVRKRNDVFTFILYVCMYVFRLIVKSTPDNLMRTFTSRGQQEAKICRIGRSCQIDDRHKTK